MSDIDVSVIVATWKAVSFVERSIGSALASTGAGADRNSDFSGRSKSSAIRSHR